MKFPNVIFNIKIILAIALFICLLPMPYGYYTLVRFVAMIVFAVMAYQYYKEKKDTLMITFGALALLFQPFIKISLGREIWNFVDVVVAGLLLYLLWKERKEQT